MNAEMLDSDVGVFYKRRDLQTVVNGKNPIIEHIYMGKEVKDRDILVVDDMIASGNSMLEVAEKLKSQGANNIYFIATLPFLRKELTNLIKLIKKAILLNFILLIFLYTIRLSS